MQSAAMQRMNIYTRIKGDKQILSDFVIMSTQKFK